MNRSRFVRYCLMVATVLVLVTIIRVLDGVNSSSWQERVKLISRTIWRNDTASSNIHEDNHIRRVMGVNSEVKDKINSMKYPLLDGQIAKSKVDRNVTFELKKRQHHILLETRRASVLNSEISRSDVLPDNASEVEKYYTLSEKVINPLNYDILIGSSKKCSKDQHMMIIIPSSVEHVTRRRAVRMSYGKFGHTYPVNGLRTYKSNVKIDHVFVLGRDGNKYVDSQVEDESKHFNDIILVDFIDSYYNLTLKVLLGLKWVRDYCPGVKYVLKVDDDVFVNIPLLLSRIENYSLNQNGYVYGTIFDKYVPIVPTGKWAVKKTEYPLKYYPPYAQGTSYTISGNLVSKIVNTAQYLPYLHIEDAFITGIVAGKIHGASLIHINGSSNWVDEVPDPCTFVREKRIAQSKMTPTTLIKTMKSISEPRRCYIHKILTVSLNDNVQNARLS